MKDNRIRTFQDFVGELQVTYRRTKLATKKITNAREAVDFMKSYFDLCMDDHEEVKILHLNRMNMVVNIHHVTCGTDGASLVPIKDILRQAILIKTMGIILFHNHPSGNLKPSKSDIKISLKLKEACKLLEIEFLDSIIITREGFYSLMNEKESSF